MEENREQMSNDFKDINDDQERFFFQLSFIRDKNLIDSQKIAAQLHELKLLHVILYTLIISGIITFFILILLAIHFLIIIIDIGIVAIFLIYLKYLNHKYRTTLKITKKDFKHFIKLEKELSSLQIFIYLIIIFSVISILIMGIDPLILIIMIAFSIIYIYFDKEFEDDNTSNI